MITLLEKIGRFEVEDEELEEECEAEKGPWEGMSKSSSRAEERSLDDFRSAFLWRFSLKAKSVEAEWSWLMDTAVEPGRKFPTEELDISNEDL